MPWDSVRAHFVGDYRRALNLGVVNHDIGSQVPDLLATRIPNALEERERDFFVFAQGFDDADTLVFDEGIDGSGQLPFGIGRLRVWR